ACWAGVAAGMYPYGGTRHSILFALPVALVVSFAASLPARERLQIAAPSTALLLALAWMFAGPPQQIYNETDNARTHSVQNAAYLKEKVPPGGLVFTDYQSILLLCYYADPKRYCWATSNRHFITVDLGPYRVAAATH